MGAGLALADRCHQRLRPLALGLSACSPREFLMSVDHELKLMRLQERRRALRAERVGLVNGLERRGPESIHPSDEAVLDRIARELADVGSQIRLLERQAR